MAYRFIDHTELSCLIKNGAVMGRDIAVVDVRGTAFFTVRLGSCQLTNLALLKTRIS